jgi:hypothetical protein
VPAGVVISRIGSWFLERVCAAHAETNNLGEDTLLWKQAPSF